VLVAGGARGVGATTVALNLAVGLAAQGRRAVLVDADLERGDVAARCRVEPRHTILDLLAGRRSVHEVLERGPGGVQVLPGGWAPHDALELSAAAGQRLLDSLADLAAHADVTVVDAGCGRDPLARRLWHAADAVLLVTTTTTEGLMDAYAAAKLLLSGDERSLLATFVNRAASDQAAAEAHSRIAAACRRFLGRTVLAAGVAPFDAALGVDSRADRLAGSGGSLSQSPAAAAIERAAELLWSQLASSTASNALA
jgi:flagellar biosynthesis protein FlhG